MSTVEFESFSMTDASMRPLPLLLATGDEDQKKATAAAQVLRAALSTDSASQLTPDVAATPLARRAKFLEEALSRALSNDAASLSAAIEQAVASTHAAEVAHVVAARDPPADALVKPAVSLAQAVVVALLNSWPAPIATPAGTATAPSAAPAPAPAVDPALATELHTELHARLHRLLLTSMSLLCALLPEGRAATLTASIHVAGRHRKFSAQETRNTFASGTMELPSGALQVCLHVAYTLTSKLLPPLRAASVDGGGVVAPPPSIDAAAAMACASCSTSPSAVRTARSVSLRHGTQSRRSSSTARQRRIRPLSMRRVSRPKSGSVRARRRRSTRRRKRMRMSQTPRLTCMPSSRL